MSMFGEAINVSKSHHWIMFHGDAFEVLEKGLTSRDIDFCFTSPSPYKWKDQPYGIGSEKYVTDYIENLVSLFHLVSQTLSRDGSLMVHIADSYNPDIGGLLYIPERFALLMLQKGWLCKGKLIWQRPYYGYESKYDRFRYDWEYVYWFSKSKHPYFNSFSGAVGHTSIFAYEPSGIGFPREMLKTFIESCCPEHGIVLDPLCSNASTGEEALKVKRKFIGIEIIEEKYKVAVENLEKVENE